MNLCARPIFHGEQVNLGRVENRRRERGFLAENVCYPLVSFHLEQRSIRVDYRALVFLSLVRLRRTLLLGSLIYRTGFASGIFLGRVRQRSVAARLAQGSLKILPT